MCPPDSRPPPTALEESTAARDDVPTPNAPGARWPPGAPETGSRRLRLWQLGSHAHCPVVGVCMPMSALRRLAARHIPGHERDSDYDLHCIAVTASKTRNVVSEALQKDLERRFPLCVRRAMALRTTDALEAWWRQAANGQNLPGALWATLTHPRCDAELAHRVLGEVHMLQHQVGMATRVEIGRFESLIDENAVLTRELAAAQLRSQRAAREAARRTETLEAESMRLRAAQIGRDSLIAQQREQLASLEAAAPALRQRVALTRELQQLTERNQDLQRALARACDEAERQRQRAERLLAESGAAAAAGQHPPAPAALARRLDQRAVLCVGGRTASVPIYRRVVERTGGRFLHHDGGEEDSASQLDDTLGAADLVICQTGCISHGAYWRVKDHCKRTGKPCLFVETPSRSALERALREAAIADIDAAAAKATAQPGA